MPTIRVLYSNIQSFSPKELLISNYIENNYIDLALFVETKLKASKKIMFKNWSTFQLQGQLITNYPRGGCLVLGNPKLQLIKENSPKINYSLNECVHFSIPIPSKHTRLHFFLVYIHPTLKIEENILTMAAKYEYAIIIGDFNVNANKLKQIRNFLSASNFTQCSTGPTFLMPANKDSTPDLILCSSEVKQLIGDITLSPDLCSDHLSLDFPLKLDITLPNIEPSNARNINKCNTELLNSMMLIFVDSNPVITNETISKFLKTLSDNATSLSPIIKQHKTKLNTLPPFIISMIKRKRRLYRDYKQILDPTIKTQINKFSNHIKTLINQYRAYNWISVCQEINDLEGKQFWEKIKRLSRYKSREQASDIIANNIRYASKTEKCQIFADHFEEAYTSVNNLNFDNQQLQHVNNWYNNFFNSKPKHKIKPKSIDVEEYWDAVNQGKNSCAGNDFINRRIVRALKDPIHEYIRKIFNFILENNYFPPEWKSGLICVIPKPNQDHSLPSSYRPITLLPVLGKTLEQIMKTRLLKEIENRIPDLQFGFMKGKSTILPLTILANNVHANRAAGLFSVALFLDINKAFDTVWHKGLLYKLFLAGCSSYMLKLIRSFLENRSLQISIDRSLSRNFVPLQGVPQGSPLSPILYNLFCSDIDSAIHQTDSNYVLQYADDTAIVIHEKSLKKAMESLQERIVALEKWFNNWRIQPNPSKSQLILFNHRLTDTSPTISMCGITIQPQPTAKYLGITLDNKLNFRIHATLSKKRATQRARYFRSLSYGTKGINLQSKVLIYKLICRPLLEYGSMLFWNAKKCCVRPLFTAERICLRSITKIRNPRNPLHNPSNQLLYEKCKLRPLEERFILLLNKFVDKPMTKKISMFLTKPPNTRRTAHPSLFFSSLIEQHTE